MEIKWLNFKFKVKIKIRVTVFLIKNPIKDFHGRGGFWGDPSEPLFSAQPRRGA
jgi:hypothetical protein